MYFINDAIRKVKKKNHFFEFRTLPLRGHREDGRSDGRRRHRGQGERQDLLRHERPLLRERHEEGPQRRLEAGKEAGVGRS